MSEPKFSCLQTEKISYGVICEQMPDPIVFFDNYEKAVEWAENNQPVYRPWYIVERTEHFEVCGVVQ